MALVVLVALRRQRGENVVEIAHDILILRLLRYTATTTRLGIDLIVLAMATTIVLLRRSIIQSQFGEQIGSRFCVTATTALRSLVKAIQSVHSGHNVRGILACRRFVLLAAAGTLGTLSALDAGPSRGFGSRLFRILSIISLTAAASAACRPLRPYQPRPQRLRMELRPELPKRRTLRTSERVRSRRPALRHRNGRPEASR